MNHSEACRNRIGEELIKKGDVRVMREKERWEEGLTGAIKEEERKMVIERSEEEERIEEERLFGDEEEIEEQEVNDEEEDIVMELSKSVKKWNGGEETMKKKMEEENMCWGDLNGIRQEGHVMGKRYWDDLSGEELDPSMVMAARSEELKELAKRNVYNKVP